MGSGEVEDQKGGRGGGMDSIPGGTISCSICIEAVTDNGDRSIAKLQCGHYFHLDCIGSAFNVKGVMQCPNCRKVEKGQWLFSNGCRGLDYSLEDWHRDEDLYDFRYEFPFGLPWCPFRAFPHPPAFEEGEPSSTSFHDLYGGHTIFTEHASGSSSANAYPYVALHAFVQPLHPSSNSSEGADGPAFQHHWAGLSGPADIPSPQGFPPPDFHGSWEPHSPPFSPSNSLVHGTDQPPPSALRSSRSSVDSDGLPRLGPFMHPFMFGTGDYRSAPRGGSAVISPPIPSFILNSRGHARAHAYQQQPSSSSLRGAFPMSSRRSNPHPAPPVRSNTVTPLDHGSFFSTPSSASASSRSRQDGESSGSRQSHHHHGWERERMNPFPWMSQETEPHWWGPFPHSQNPNGGSDPSNRHYWQLHGVDRVMQGQSSAGSTNGLDSANRNNWWHLYPGMDRGQGQNAGNGAGGPDTLNRSNSMWPSYGDHRSGQGRSENPYHLHPRIARMPPFM